MRYLPCSWCLKQSDRELAGRRFCSRCGPAYETTLAYQGARLREALQDLGRSIRDSSPLFQWPEWALRNHPVETLTACWLLLILVVAGMLMAPR